MFDVDGTLVDSLTGSSLRPGAAEVLEGLRRDGARVLLWSAGGATYAVQRAEQHGIDALVDGCFDKDGRDAAGRYVPAFLADPLAATYVDDRPEDMPVGATVVAVSPYLGPDVNDTGLTRGLSDTRR